MHATHLEDESSRLSTQPFSVKTKEASPLAVPDKAGRSSRSSFMVVSPLEYENFDRGSRSTQGFLSLILYVYNTLDVVPPSFIETVGSVKFVISIISLTP